MKWKIFLLILLLVVLLPAQTVTTQYRLTASAPTIGTLANGGAANETNSGTQYRKITWTTTGTVATCSVRVDSSADNITYTAGGAITAQTCTSNGASTVASGVFNYTRINITAISGGGSVKVVYQGFPTQPSGGGTVTGGPFASGNVITGGGGSAISDSGTPLTSLTNALLPGAGTQIISSSVDANGNPNFLSAGAGATINVNGGTTAITYVINGTYQTITSNISVTPATPSNNNIGTVWLFVKKNASGVAGASDLVASNTAPFWRYSAPTAPSPATALSSTNPSIWFDLSTNTTKQATSNAGAYSTTTDMISLGTAVITTTPAVLAVLPEPYGLTNFRRLNIFGDGSGDHTQGNPSITTITGTTTPATGIHFYRGGNVNGGVLRTSPNNTANAIATVIYSQTPIIITNGGALGQAGGGTTGPAGTANANSSAGIAGGFAASGASGGGGTANTSGAGGAVESVGRPNQVINGGAAASAGANGNNGTAGSGFSVDNYSAISITIWFGGGGGTGSGGAGEAGSTGGAGGNGGSVIYLIAPSILIDTGCTATAAGGAGANGTGTNSSGGGGGGGGIVLLAGGFVTQNGTLTAAGGAGGTGVGTGHTGGTGGTGQTKVLRLW